MDNEYDMDLFEIGPVLGKGYPEYDPDQQRGKDGRWARGSGGAGGGRGKSPKGGRKPAKPKAPAKKPKAEAKKPAAKKPKASEKKPKAEAKKPRKPRQRRSEAAAEEKKPSTALVPVPQEKPIDIEAEPVPERPSGLVERDRKELEDHYKRYDEALASIEQMRGQLDALKAKGDALYDDWNDAARAGQEGRTARIDRELSRIDGETSRLRDSLGRRIADRDRIRSTITDLESRLRGQKRDTRIAALFKRSKAFDFRSAFAKLVPDNGQSQQDNLGLVFGWAIVCKDRGSPYFDTQGDHIPEDSMLKAATDFMLNRRDLKVMHKGRKVGTVVFAWPVTKEISKAMGFDGNKTGLMIGVKPDSSNIVDRFRSGQYTGFSIGGNRLIDEPVE